MNLTAANLKIVVNLPANLTDTADKVWFYSADDWIQYWNDASITLRLSIPSVPVVTYTYNPAGIAETRVTVSGQEYHLVTFAAINALKTRADALVTSMISMRQSLINAGWLVEETVDNNIGQENATMGIGTEQGQAISVEKDSHIQKA
jgi:hypothetical protein